MAQELFRTRCSQGKLIITDEAIIIHIDVLGVINTVTLPRDVFTSLEFKTKIAPLFGLGGGGNFVFHGRGAERMAADMVGMKAARKIIAILNAKV